MEQENLYIASLSRRFLGFFLDFILLLIPSALASQIVPVVGGLAVWFFYAPVLEASAMRATPGKFLVGIQVSDLSGRRISIQAATIRNLLKIISFALLLIGFIFALFTEKKQTLHDLLSDTLVVYGRSERPILETWVEAIKDLFRSTSGEAESTVSQLERLERLREKGAITEEEFLLQKRKILGGSI